MTSPPEGPRCRGGKRPDFHQLEVFLEVADAGSFSGAARRIGRTQPAVSQAISRLEEIYGGDLFERRRGRPLSLTPIGEAILPSAQIILRTVDHHMRQAASAAQGRMGSLSVGFEPGLGSFVLTPILLDFASNPSVELRFVEGESHGLRRRLREGSIDLLFEVHRNGSEDPCLASETVRTERLALIVRHDHAIAAGQSPTWGRLTSLPLIMSLADRGVPWLEGLDVSWHDVSAETIGRMVSLGLGVSLGLAEAVRCGPGTVAVLFEDDEATVPIACVWSREDRNPLRHRLLKHLRDAK